MSSIKHYLALVKFSHTIFAMPFALIGFTLGVQQKMTETTITNWQSYIYAFIGVLVCMVTARNAAMAFNRYLDREFDAKNPRTAIREIPKGIISPQNALRFVIVNCFVFITATYFINSLCFALSPIALLVVLGYSYTKRFTPLCHLVLGLGLSLAPIGAYLAVTGTFDLLPVLFSFTVLFWVSGFDIIYALQDEEFDKDNNLHSIPSWMGTHKALYTSEYLHFLSIACIVIAGILGHFSWFYWAGVTAFAFFLVYQHTLVKPNDLSKVNKAFFTSNGIASVVFGALVLVDIFI